MNYDEALRMYNDYVHLEGDSFEGKEISLILIIEAAPGLSELKQSIQAFLTFNKICWPNTTRSAYEIVVFFNLIDYLSPELSNLDWIPLSRLLDRMSKPE